MPLACFKSCHMTECRLEWQRTFSASVWNGMGAVLTSACGHG
jgi:hypothetical protein